MLKGKTPVQLIFNFNFPTFDRVPLSRFLYLSVNTEEEQTMHYMQGLCPADGRLSTLSSSVISSILSPSVWPLT